ncbi:kelch repeat-containing protein [Bacteroidota bacterium]
MLRRKILQNFVKKIYFRELSLIIISLAIVSVQISAQNGWTRKTQSLTPRAGACACVVDNKIYVIGGITGSPGYIDLDVNEVYDLSTNTWETKTPLPVARGYLSCAVVNGIIYAIGGGYPTARKRVDAYDPVTDTWTQKQDMINARRSAQAAVVDGIIYNIGGNIGNNQPSPNCEAYDPGTDTWTSKTSMPSGGGNLAVTGYDGMIYTFGGSTYSPWSGFSNVYAYNPQTDAWTPRHSMPTARFGLQTYFVNGKIYAIGGSQSSGTSLSTVEVYNPVTDTWENRDNMPFTSVFFAGATANNKIYTIGGTSDFGIGELDMWEYDPNVSFDCSPNSINFGDVVVGNSSTTFTITIKNIGNQPFNITSVKCSKNEFVLSNVPLFPVNIEPSGSIQFQVAFFPNCFGKTYDKIIATTDNSTNSTLAIQLEGRGILFGPQFQSFVEHVNSADYLDRTAIVDSFLTEHSVMPLVEQDSICIFIYRGNASTISVAGDANGWDPIGSQMKILSSTNLWYYADIYEPDARLDYKFVENGSNYILDPLNPNQILGGFGPNSEIAMPAYIQPPEIEYYSNIPHGKIHTFSFSSNILGNSRTIKVYTPPDYDSYPEKYYPVILFHDGLEYITLGSANNTIDYLLSEGRIGSIIAVFVPPVNRDDEYAFNLTEQYESFIVDELMPHIDLTYRTLSAPEFRAMTGLSYGGLLTTQICYNRPESFALAAAFSPSYWPKNMEVINSVLSGPQKGIKWYIDWGTYEPEFSVNARLFKDGLEAGKYEIQWNEWHEAHSWGSWRAHLDNALEFFFPNYPSDVAEVKEIKTTFMLMQNYPNPFNPSTKIQYSIPKQSSVILKVFDVLGSEVATIVNKEQPQGFYEVDFDGSNLSNGIYFYQLKAGDVLQTKKMILLR